MGRRSELSVSEEGPHMRIRICMRRFFSDERSRVLLLVPVRRRVRWLRRRLRALFPLPPRLALLVSGHLLPPDEPLALLAHDDLVEVIPRGSNSEKIELFGDRENASNTMITTLPYTVSGMEVTETICPSTLHQKHQVMFASAAPQNIDETIDAMPHATRRVGYNLNGSMHEVSDGKVSDSGSADAERDSHPATEPKQLYDSKLRALEMLDRYCGTTDPSPSEVAPRARRRRVRRRRRPPHSSPPSGHGAAQTSRMECNTSMSDAAKCSSMECSVLEDGTTDCSVADSVPGPVVRNTEAPRAPRLVRSLSPVAPCNAVPAPCVLDAFVQQI